MITVLFLALLVLLVIGIPVSVGISLASIIALVTTSNIPLLILPQRFFSGLNSFSFMSIPLFILAGDIMAEAKISERLVNLASLFVGSTTGGLAHVATGSSAFFGAVSGSAPATTAAIGSIMIPSMKEEGYDPAYSAAVVAASGILGNIIPPSLTMVVFGVTASVSIGSMFMSGIVPGILLALMIMACNYIICRRKNLKGVKVQRTIGEKMRIIRESILALLMPLIILGGIYAGIFTATESAAVACLYGVIVGKYIYKTLTWKSIFNVFKRSSENIGMIFLLMASAALFTYIIARNQLPSIFASALLGLTTSQYVIMFLILAILLFLGTFLDSVSALILIVPTFMEVIKSANIDPLYFGVFTVIAIGVGMITPPVGLNLFVATNISGSKFEDVVKWASPYILVYLVFLVFAIFVPGILTLFRM